MDPLKATVLDEIFGNLSNFEDEELLNSEHETCLDLMHVSESESVPDCYPDPDESVSDNFLEQPVYEDMVVQFRENYEPCWTRVGNNFVVVLVKM